MRSVVAPVRALMGFMVRLPHSLNQMPFWMQSVPSTSMPPRGSVPSCSQAGVLGVLAGVVGTLQATEAVKHLLGIGDPLTDRLLTYDALTMKFRAVAVKRNPRCALCGAAPTITELRDEAPPACDLKKR